MENETICQEAKRILTPIPTENWVCGAVTGNKVCVMAHLGKIYNGLGHDWRGKPNAVKDIAWSQKFDIININNYPGYGYDQPTPKERVMALLNDLIAKGL